MKTKKEDQGSISCTRMWMVDLFCFVSDLIHQPLTFFRSNFNSVYLGEGSRTASPKTLDKVT